MSIQGLLQNRGEENSAGWLSVQDEGKAVAPFSCPLLACHMAVFATKTPERKRSKPLGGGDVVRAMIALREQNTSSESQGDTGALRSIRAVKTRKPPTGRGGRRGLERRTKGG
ncbi:hypothetical protein EYF80_057132 [Liparis tanakae]|uniref:Uncharacterized protein n=1 Tax=Liparis tanakae TaxID=230148 RepID=A0A4Z2EWG8_9TELE|nr:hypothetical protein EYF80_057132 [Liparis tanakae]